MYERVRSRMAQPTIYVAGPVPRPTTLSNWKIDLSSLYARIANASSLASVRVQLPQHDPALDSMDAIEFANEIGRRIDDARALIVLLIDSHRPNPTADYSIACEAQRGAQSGKTISLVAQSPERVPRLLRALAGGRQPHSLDAVNFRELLQGLAESNEGMATA